MKDRAVVSERGTITIPEPIRRRAGIHSGDLIEFYPKGEEIILKHLIVTHPKEEQQLTIEEWDKFDSLIQRQFQKGQYTSYSDLHKARQHSRSLMRKK